MPERCMINAIIRHFRKKQPPLFNSDSYENAWHTIYLIYHQAPAMTNRQRSNSVFSGWLESFIRAVYNKIERELSFPVVLLVCIHKYCFPVAY